MRYLSFLLCLLFTQIGIAQDPCDPPLVASLSVFPTTICTGGVATITFSLPPDDGDAFDVLYSVNGATALLQGVLDGHTEQISVSGNTTITLVQVTNNDDDDDGCFTNFNIQVTVAVSEIQVGFSMQNPACGQSNGSITVSPNGGAPPFQYSLNGGNVQNNPVFSGLNAGDYTISVVDNNGCTGETFASLVSGDAPDILVISQVNPACGQNNGAVTLTANGGTTPYQYSMNGGAFQNSASFGSLGAGNYTFTVQDAANCTALTLVVLTDNSATLPLANIVANDTRGCSGTVFELTANAPAGTTGIWTCNGCNIPNPTQTQLVISGLPPGNTAISWTLSSPNCPNYSKATVTLTILAPPQANTDGIFQVEALDALEVAILANDVASAPVLTEVLRLPQKGTANLSPNHQLTYQPTPNALGLDTLIYALCYEECPQECDTAMVVFQIFSEDDPCFITGDTTNILTNGLTPNNDNVNDKLVFRIVDIVECEVNYLLSDLIIYNRWGDVVYESKPYNNDWGGTSRDGSPLPPGVYYFVLRVKDTYSQFGNVIIIR